MKGELSHGLPALITAGDRILRGDTRNAISLRGINRSGLEYAEPSDGGFLSAADFSQAELQEIILRWRANVVRVPFNQDWALNGRNLYTAEDYRAALDQIIDWAAALGAYTILDLQWLDAETIYGHASGRENHVAPTPNAGTLNLWADLAARYRDEPAVLFDLFNEPHDPVDDDPLPIHIIDEIGNVAESDADFVGPDEWVPWATRLVSEVRRFHPNALILVGGVDWAFDLRHVRVDAPNIVYSAHIYPNRGRHTWWKAFGSAAEVPVFVGEWGGRADDLAFGRRLARVLRAKACGWTAWSWVDDPKLIQTPRAPQYQPTDFGALVQNELRT
jgi:endoglucanase